MFITCLIRLHFFSPPDKLDLKRRRTERIRRERIESSLTNDMENRRRSRANSQSDPIRRGRGRPKTVGLKKQEEDKGKIRRDALNEHLRVGVGDVCFLSPIIRHNYLRSQKLLVNIFTVLFSFISSSLIAVFKKSHNCHCCTICHYLIVTTV